MSVLDWLQVCATSTEPLCRNTALSLGRKFGLQMQFFFTYFMDCIGRIRFGMHVCVWAHALSWQKPERSPSSISFHFTLIINSHFCRWFCCWLKFHSQNHSHGKHMVLLYWVCDGIAHNRIVYPIELHIQSCYVQCTPIYQHFPISQLAHTVPTIVCTA